MARARTRTLVIVLILLAAIGGIGYMSMEQSNYKPLSDILSLDHKAKVTVEANTTSLGRGNMTLIVGDKVYTVSAHGSYGVARDGEGNVYAVFLLEDDGKTALALYPVGDELLAYQTGSGLQTSVVVSGVYDPSVRAVLVGPDGRSMEFPLIQVDAILKGCHTSYEQSSATIG